MRKSDGFNATELGYAQTIIEDRVSSCGHEELKALLDWQHDLLRLTIRRMGEVKDVTDDK